jgi:GntR family transcriptional regulator
MSIANKKQTQTSFLKLNPRSPIPLYFQLQEIIKKKIENGEYAPGELIPTEKELQHTYGVSRITVRNAINGLVFEDMLIKKQGYGTMVASPRMVEDFSRLRSFTEKMEAQGAEVTTRVLEIEMVTSDSRISHHLQIESDTPILRIKRLRYVNGEPIALFTNYIRSDIGVGTEDDFSGSIFRLLEEKNHLSISLGEKVIEAMIARSEDAKQLEIQTGDPVLLIRNTVFDDHMRPIDYAEGVYRGDRYKYVVKLKR